MFIGEYIYSIDAKKRLAIPAKFRRDLEESAVITKGLDNCLVVYPMKVWEKWSEKLENLPTGPADARDFSRMLLSGASEVELDKLGRILISDSLKEYAGLKKSVAVIGLSNKIEIWDADKWQEYKKKTEMAVGNIAEKLKELGV